MRNGPKNKHLAEKRSFEGICDILRTISNPRTLSADIPVSQEGVYLFYIPTTSHFRLIATRQQFAELTIMYDEIELIIVLFHSHSLAFGQKRNLDIFSC